MIKGKIKEELIEFESEIQALLGNYIDGYGYIYYFALLKETYSRAAKHLINDSQKFKNELINEDLENIPSLIKFYESVSNPLIQTLYNSYFITVHSELESMLLKVKNIVQKHYSNFTFPKKTNDGFKTFNDKSETLVFIKDALTKHEILIIYNYIRNGITHPKNDKTCKLYFELENHINSGKINFLEIINNDYGFNFKITDINFIYNYTEEIISFFQGLIDNSIKYRNQFP